MRAARWRAPDRIGGLRAAARELATERFLAVLDRNDVLLRTGQHTRLLPELTALAAAHPLDERLAGQVMLAWYRSGRHADALGHYRAVRERLVTELGNDPGPELQRPHQQILRQDPDLTLAPAAGRSSSTPAQLPADLATFTGRAIEMRRLDALLPSPDQSSTVVIVAGADCIERVRVITAQQAALDHLPRQCTKDATAIFAACPPCVARHGAGARYR